MLLAGIASASAWQNGYVIGGSVVAPNSEPHILSLQRSSHFCGGTVVSATHGMTAAHCYYSPSIVNAVAGAHNIKQNESTQQKVGLTKFQRHPNYNSNNISNDIAVLEFASSLTLNEYVVPAKLPAHTEGEWMSENDVIHVCGWGNTLVIGSNYPAELHCVDTLYVPVSKCNARTSYNGSILPGNLRQFEKRVPLNKLRYVLCW